MPARLPRITRSRPRRLLVVVGVAAVALGVGGCVPGQPDASRNSIVEALTDSGVPAEQAGCVADSIFEAFGDDQETLNQIRDADKESDLDPEVAQVVEDAVEACQEQG